MILNNWLYRVRRAVGSPIFFFSYSNLATLDCTFCFEVEAWHSSFKEKKVIRDISKDSRVIAIWRQWVKTRKRFGPFSVNKSKRILMQREKKQSQCSHKMLHNFCLAADIQTLFFFTESWQSLLSSAKLSNLFQTWAQNGKPVKSSRFFTSSTCIQMVVPSQLYIFSCFSVGILKSLCQSFHLSLCTRIRAAR